MLFQRFAAQLTGACRELKKTLTCDEGTPAKTLTVYHDSIPQKVPICRDGRKSTLIESLRG